MKIEIEIENDFFFFVSINMVSKTENKFQPSKAEIFGSFKNFKLLITASSNSGKSHLIKNLLTDKSFGIYNRFPAD
jgi:hypothetical protein